MTDTEVSEPIRVVGVVGDAKYGSLRDEGVPTVYFALRQQPWFGRYPPTYQLLVDGDAASLAALARATVAELGAGASADTELLSAQLSASLSRERLMATISAFFGGLTLLLAVIGLYGVMSFHVARRFAEIGVRLALGSTRGGVFALVLRRAAGPLIVGLVLGALGSAAAVRAIASFAYGLDPYDPRLFTLPALALAVAALLSAAIPARRAADLDPALVLREGAE
jgi:ABC-type antimicrobial peptide transport system permease subunit